jgi:TolB-like protein
MGIAVNVKPDIKFLEANMKRTFFRIIPLMIFIIGMGCAGGARPAENSPAGPAANSDGLTLDQALKEAAERIDERIAAGSKIAPLNFTSPHDKFSGYVLDELTVNLVDSRKLTVVDRKEVELIRGEFDFQFSGEVGDDSMQELGRMLGAQSIISGSLTDLGGFQRIVIRVLNVQNASVEVQYRANIINDAIVTALLTGGKSGGTTGTPQRASSGGAAGSGTRTVQADGSAPAAAQPAAVAPAEVIKDSYAIGETGPAGGIIFYDKGDNSSGWQYLEAAPASTEGKNIQWAANSGSVKGTSTEIGTGKQNTQAIMKFALQTGENMAAARLCDRLQYGGYNDWFLPSKVELGIRYLNLKMEGIGGFSEGSYWSSSESGKSNGAWSQNFSDGRQNDDGYASREGAKHTEKSVRAVRAF